MKKTKKAHQYIFLAMVCILLALIVGMLLGRELEKRTYKLTYADLIEKYALQYTLDPYLVAAVIHTESSNRPGVTSVAGARGLMQVMPETGAWIAGKLDENKYSQDDLFDPETSIRYGCWYLRFLLDRYDHDVVLTLAAYNAGQGTVDKWLSDPAVSEGRALVNIPYPQTDKYIQKVQHAHEKYQTLYKNAF